MKKDKIVLFSILGVVVLIGAVFAYRESKKNQDENQPDEVTVKTKGQGGSMTVIENNGLPNNVVGKPKAGAKPIVTIGQQKPGIK